MRSRHLIFVSLAAGLVLPAACRRTHVDPNAAAPAASAPVVEEASAAVDALTPPPRPRPPDFATPPSGAATMNGHPQGPKQADFDVVQADAQRKVQSCLDAIPATAALPGGVARLAIRYEVGNDGHPRGVDVTGEVPPDTLACGKTAIESAIFPAFQGSPLRNAFSLTYSRAIAPDLATK